MNQYLQKISLFLQQAESLSADEKASLTKAVAEAAKEMEITAFKLDRTEKVKRTTAILLEETIEELEQKRIAVEAQNRELEIEAALEKVRSRSLAMHKSEELAEASVILFEQLKILGVSTYSSGFSIWDNEDLISWMCNADGSLNPPFRMPVEGDAWHRRQYESWENGEEFIWKDLKGEEMQAHFRHLRSFPLLDEAFKKSIAAGHPMPERQVHHVANFAQGNLLFITLQPCPEAHDIFRRFAKVFEQTYTRFLDLQKAEAQAREAQIEAALERVRAQTMAMHSSEDVGKCIVKMFSELTSLGVDEGTRFGIGILNHDNENIQLWTARKDGEEVNMHIGNLDMSWHPLLKSARKAWKEQVPLHQYVLEGEDLLNYYLMINTAPDYKLQIAIEKLPEREFHYGFVFEHGFFYAFSPHEFQPDLIRIAQRFSSLFEQTYRRYLDLVRAEAQAREAKIEAALERVRSRSMAMHNSADLSAVVYGMFTELVKLDAQLDRCLILIVNPQTFGITWYLTGKEGLLSNNGFLVQDNPQPSHQAYLEGWRTRRKKWQYLLAGDEKRDWDAFGFTQTGLSQLPDFIKADMTAVEAIHLTISSDDFGCLIASSLSPLSDVHAGIVDRFTTVFNQTYTRFLDLQKAEAQAREAKIEAALERVRSRSMAMHKSDELHSVVNTLYGELQSLKVNFHVAAIQLFPDNSMDLHLWLSTSDGMYNDIIHWPYTDLPVFHEMYKSRTTGKMLEFNMDETATREFFDEYFNLEGVPKERKTATQNVKVIAIIGAYQKLTGIFLMRYSEGSYSQYEKDIVNRFSKAFEQTYTRFLDLQKAEAQAWEAQIEAALERVRVQAMGMHKSEDLLNVSKVLYEELKRLGIDEIRNAMILMHDQKKDFFYDYDYSSIGSKISQIPNKGLPLVEKYVKDVTENTKKQEGFIELIIANEELAAWKKFRKATGQLDDPRLDPIDTLYYYHYFMGSGNVSISTFAALSKEKIQLLERFRNVFQLPYQRYQDIEVAEAQAREAQIEAALERVRAKAMAMYGTSDISEATAIVFNELSRLGISMERCGIGVWKEPFILEIWSTTLSPKDKQVVDIITGSVNAEIHPMLREGYRAWKNKNDFFSYELSGIEVKEYYELLERQPDYHFPKVGNYASRQILNTFNFDEGYIFVYTNSPLLNEEKKIIQRFSNVFALTYRRYQDLIKAEAQARETQIEAALERVRSRSMGMQKSEELKEVIKLVYRQLLQLKINLDHAGFVVDYKPKGDWHFWIADEQDIPSKITHPYFESVWANQFNEAKEKSEDLFVTNLNFEEKNKFYQELLSYVPGLPEASKDFYLSCPGLAVTTVLFNNVGLYIENFSGTPYTEEDNTTLMRFGKVFQQTYTRFLDLQKAEAQAREAQIEAALDRLRARSMGMHKSEELIEVVRLLDKEIKGLGVEVNGSQIVTDFANPEDGLNDWYAREGQAYMEKFHVPYLEHPLTKRLYNALQNGVDFYTENYSKTEKNKYFRLLFKYSDFRKTSKERQEFVFHSPAYIRAVAVSKNSTLIFQRFDINEFTKEEEGIFKRFGNVFEQAYTRFLDLQKAEAQAREAQIEASLERLRSKTMAMHNSHDVGESVATILDELERLEVKIKRCGVLIYGDSSIAEVWTAKSNSDGKATLIIGQLDMNMHPMLSGAHNSWLNKESSFAYELAGEDIKNYFRAINDTKTYPHHFNIRTLPPKEFHSDFHFRDGSIFAFTAEQIPVEAIQILSRFAGVFGQTYRRFLDLQKAEAQAREAQIELALERVRSKAMAMHNSVELQEVVNTVHTSLVELGVKMDSANFNILHKGSRDMDLWVANLYSQRIHLPYIDRKPVKDMMDAHEKGINSLQVACTYEEKNLFWNEAFETTGFKNVASTERKKFILESKCWTILWTLAKHCCIQLNSYSRDSYTQEEVEIMKRFTNVFEQAYTRFLDLQKAEAQALEAIKRASVDRVRAEIASMRTKQDLERITPLIWKELTTLGIPFVRCGVFIMDEQKELIHTFLSTPEGKAIAAFHLPYNSNPFFNAIDEWRAKKIHITHWDISEFATMADYLVKEGQVATREQYLSTVPQGGLYLHYIPFLQGILYVGNITSLTEDNLHLVQSVADAFSTAYARYEDFNKLEAAKKQVDSTLNELQVTQKQLVQSEKMASLGELTAGIAHEIQNPLNFVNNFSEVSMEMIEDLKAERSKVKGERDEALEEELLNDVVQNLEKINHHGKRAADIVKGMLQHSRTSSGQKELTDLNALADEYLRLAYHGLRAKDKSFNADFKADLDPALPKLNVIPQDIGRVLLNLINNAFYVVSEKSKTGSADGLGYKPNVTVKTKKKDNLIEIRVKDNGAGIPDEIVNKIFQPFFTTKPTGQGTGLGLSLSYDIITKGHNGTLEVDTTSGLGSEFIIQLPVVCITDYEDYTDYTDK